ncbi:AKL18 protein, partial [Puccinia sorghi]
VKISWEYKHPTDHQLCLPIRLHNVSQPSPILFHNQRRELSRGGKIPLSLDITQQRLSIQCAGFEMWYHSIWACGQDILRSSSTVIPSDPNFNLVLIQNLCSKHTGKLELQVSKKRTIGAFLVHIQENNMFGLILDYNAFYKHSLDKEDNVKIIPKKSCLCLYELQYKDTITTKETSKIIKASIYDSGIIYTMVAKYSLIQQDRCKEYYITKPNHSMCRFAMASKFISLFNQTILKENVAFILKEWERKLRVCAN